jgi:hypothetical protein
MPLELKKLGLSTDEWAKLKGRLKGDVSRGATESAPVEYRDLVNRYFRELSRLGTSKEK